MDKGNIKSYGKGFMMWSVILLILVNVVFLFASTGDYAEAFLFVNIFAFPFFVAIFIFGFILELIGNRKK